MNFTNFKMPTNFNNKISCNETAWKTSFTGKPTNKIKARREQALGLYNIVFSRVLPYKLPLQRSTQNIFWFRQLISHVS